jgi:hypothetical protein
MEQRIEMAAQLMKNGWEKTLIIAKRSNGNGGLWNTSHLKTDW